MKDINVTGTDYSAIPDISEYIENGRLYVPEGIEYILEESCHSREDLEEVFLPSSLRVIGPIAFAECPSLRAVHLNAGLEEIGDGAFLGDPLLTRIELPAGLKTIGPMAFYGTGLTEIVVPPSVELIGELCFWECVSLARADVLGPSCVIEQDAFGECPALIQGYMAPGFPKDDLQPANLLFSLLWASEYDRHRDGGVRVSAEERRDYTSMHIYADDPREVQTVAERSMNFIRRNQGLVLETILRTGNAPAMRGIMEYGLLEEDILERGLREAAANGQTELAALFLTAKARKRAAGIGGARGTPDTADSAAARGTTGTADSAATHSTPDTADSAVTRGTTGTADSAVTRGTTGTADSAVTRGTTGTADSAAARGTLNAATTSALSAAVINTSEFEL